MPMNNIKMKFRNWFNNWNGDAVADFYSDIGNFLYCAGQFLIYIFFGFIALISFATSMYLLVYLLKDKAWAFVNLMENTASLIIFLAIICYVGSILYNGCSILVRKYNQWKEHKLATRAAFLYKFREEAIQDALDKMEELNSKKRSANVRGKSRKRSKQGRKA